MIGKMLNFKPEITEASCPGVSAVVAKELPTAQN